MSFRSRVVPALVAASLAATVAPLAAQPARARPASITETAAVPARRDFAHRRHIRTEFHAPSRWTIVELMPMSLGGGVELRTSFRFPGHVPPNVPGTMTFAVVGRGTGEAFGAAPRLEVVLDGGAPVPVASRRFARAATADTTETTVYATMPRATFLRLVKATRVEVRVDDRAWTLEPDMLEALRDLASRMSPAGFRAAKAREGMVAAAPADGSADAAGAMRVYTANEVDTPIRQRGLLRRPRFPDGEARAVRRVWLRYVVDTTGLVELGTLRGETPVRDSAFVESARAAAARWIFTPARKDGRAVRMEVRQVIEFDPATP